VIVVLLLIFGFKSFPIIFILTGGGPAGRTETLTVLTYNTAFRSFDFSYSATLGILAVVISVVLVLAYMHFAVRRGIGGGAPS
jgi:multiple sugar transport system permease protein